MTTIGAVVSEIICLIKIDTDDGQTDRQTDGCFCTLGVIKHRENLKVTGVIKCKIKKIRQNFPGP